MGFIVGLSLSPERPIHEPLHEASKLHITLKRAFLLALATAKDVARFMPWHWTQIT